MAAYVVTVVVIGGYALSVYWRGRQVDAELAAVEEPE
jgi:hypothetical protein